MLCDAHIHLFDLLDHEPHLFSREELKTRPMMVSHYSSREHLFYLEKRAQGHRFLLSMGVHPQLPLDSALSELEQALMEGSLSALGECGFDLYNQEFKSTLGQQETLFQAQCALAKKFSLPMVIHLRRGLDQIYKYSSLLKQVPAVVFHSWPSPLRDAESLVARGVNCYFSFGNPIRQGNKKAIETLVGISRDRILMETDAPWQTLADSPYTGLEALDENYRKAAELLNLSFESLEAQVADNFIKAYGGPFFS